MKVIAYRNGKRIDTSNQIEVKKVKAELMSNSDVVNKINELISNIEHASIEIADYCDRIVDNIDGTNDKVERLANRDIKGYCTDIDSYTAQMIELVNYPNKEVKANKVKAGYPIPQSIFDMIKPWCTENNMLFNWKWLPDGSWKITVEDFNGHFMFCGVLVDTNDAAGKKLFAEIKDFFKNKIEKKESEKEQPKEIKAQDFTSKKAVFKSYAFQVKSEEIAQYKQGDSVEVNDAGKKYKGKVSKVDTTKNTVQVDVADQKDGSVSGVTVKMPKPQPQQTQIKKQASKRIEQNFDRILDDLPEGRSKINFKYIAGDGVVYDMEAELNIERYPEGKKYEIDWQPLDENMSKDIMEDEEMKIQEQAENAIMSKSIEGYFDRGL